MPAALNTGYAWAALWVIIGWVMHLFGFCMVTIHCLRTRREATSAILWIFVSWSFPVFGPLLYLGFGVDRLPDKGLRKAMINMELQRERQIRSGEKLPLENWHHTHAEMMTQPTADQARALHDDINRILREHPLLGGNTITTHVTGDEAYPAMLAAIQQATDHIHLQSFIIAHDTIGRRFMNALAQKASEGVTVRVIYDKFGSTRAMLRGFFRRYGRIPNLHIEGWTQVNPLRRQFQVNLRNHRKLLIVDGRQAFTGGINLHDENMTSPKGRPIRDYHFQIHGPFVHELQFSFMQDWFFMTREDPSRLLCDAHFPALPPVGDAMIRLANSGPTADPEPITDILFMAITRAQQQLLIVTPYFAPPRDIVRALRSAALRGVDVRLIVPLKNNHLYAGLAGRSKYEELLDAGVRIFERPPPFMHAKAVIVDDAMAIVGTANWDVRSFRLNYETNVVVHDDGFINRLKRIILEDESLCREVNLSAWQRRPAHCRLAENLCALMTPIL